MKNEQEMEGSFDFRVTAAMMVISESRVSHGIQLRGVVQHIKYVMYLKICSIN